MSLRAFLSDVEDNSHKVEKAGASIDLFAFGNKGSNHPNAVTAENPGEIGLYLPPLPEKVGPMTGAEAAALETMATELVDGLENARKGYGALDKMGEAMTKTNVEFNKLYANQAVRTEKQLQSGADRASVMADISVKAMGRTRGLQQATDRAKAIRATTAAYASRAKELMAG